MILGLKKLFRWAAMLLTTSRTWPESTDVKIFTNSGMIAPASVPQVMMLASFHQRVVSPPMSGMSRYDDM